MATTDLVECCTKLETLCNGIKEPKEESPIEKAREEHLVAQAYLDLLKEVKRVKAKISEIIKKPANYALVEEQGNNEAIYLSGI